MRSQILNEISKRKKRFNWLYNINNIQNKIDTFTDRSFMNIIFISIRINRRKLKFNNLEGIKEILKMKRNLE